jgi:hypothetical protein
MTTSRKARDDEALPIKPVVFLIIVDVAFQLVAGVYGQPKVEMVESTYAEVIVRQVPAPAAETSSTTWFVQLIPA